MEKTKGKGSIPVFGEKILRVVLFGSAGVVFMLMGCTLLNARTPARTDLSRSPQLATPPAPLSTSCTIKVVTFNIWDLYLYSKDRAVRIPAIIEHLTALDADIIGLQESFIRKDRERIFSALAAAGLPHHQYFESGFVGSGLSIISRFPIEEAHFFRYSQGGKAHKLKHGDWWAGKGVCLARLRLPYGIGYLDFFNTHIHARYRDDPYEEVRMSQVRELEAFIEQSTSKTSPALVVGDFNTSASQPQYQTLVERAGLERLMLEDSRIDHIFGVRSSLYTFETLATVTIDAKLIQGEQSARLSDHTGYMSTLRIMPTPSAIELKPAH